MAKLLIKLLFQNPPNDFFKIKLIYLKAATCFEHLQRWGLVGKFGRKKFKF